MLTLEGFVVYGREMAAATGLALRAAIFTLGLVHDELEHGSLSRTARGECVCVCVCV